jgi:hypothetical protein
MIRHGFVKLHRELWRDVVERIDKYAKRKEQSTNGRLVIQVIWLNVGYEQSIQSGLFNQYEWKTTLSEIAKLTGLSVEQVRRSLTFLKEILLDTRQGKKSLKLLKINTLMKNQYSHPTGTAPIRQGKVRRTDRAGICIKAIFLERYEQDAKFEPTGTNPPNRPVLTKKVNPEVIKEATKPSPDPVFSISETGRDALNVNGGGLGDSSESQSSYEHEDPISYEESKEKYPQLESEIKYLTLFDKLGVEFYPTDLDMFSENISMHDTDRLHKPIETTLLELANRGETFETVEQAFRRANLSSMFFGEVEEPSGFRFGRR